MNILKSTSRGIYELEWLSSRFSFSFAEYYNPHRMGFGALRVLNDDIISPGKGYGMHPHRDMEIITIPLSGSLFHEDSMGNKGIVQTGEIQVMSAGTGVEHSEINASSTDPLCLFQIWILPHTQGVTPRYAQKAITYGQNTFTDLVSGDTRSDTLFINQEATISIGRFDEGEKIEISASEGKGCFVMIVEGTLLQGAVTLSTRDSFEIVSPKTIKTVAIGPTTLLKIEVPE